MWRQNTKRWQKLGCFFMAICVVAFIGYTQFICLISQKGKLFMHNIHRFGEVVIPSWEPYKNLHTQLYVRPTKNTTLLSGKNVCPKECPPTVLCIVCSPIENYDLRIAIRNTWASEAQRNHNISVAFLVGISEKESINTRIRSENNMYNDLIVEDFIDNNYNATIKSVMMLKWAINNCDKAKFLMKSEDDVFVNVANLEKFVNTPSRTEPPHLLVGKLVSNEIVDRNSWHDKYMPKYMYPYENYPEYLSGEGYLMAIQTASLLYQKALNSSLIHLEDIFITGISADAAAVNRLYDFRFYFIEDPDYQIDCTILYQRSLIIHSHKITVDTMYYNYEKLKNCVL